MTKVEAAQRQWDRYGRMSKSGQLFLAGYYIGRVGTDSDGQPFTFCKGERAIGFMGVQPVAVVSRYLQSSEL